MNNLNQSGNFDIPQNNSANIPNTTANEKSNDFLENFSFLLVEEFLLKHGMQKTLHTFRNEWNRPAEVSNLLKLNILVFYFVF
jgi:Ca2+-dependent lipid-binding protein